MNKLRLEYGLLVVAVTMLFGSLYYVYQWWAVLLASFSTGDLVALTVAFVATPVIAVLAVSARSRLPNYGGGPPFADLLKLITPMALIGFSAAVTALTAWSILDTQKLLFHFARWCLWPALAISVVLTGRQVALVILNIHEYYRLCTWDRRVHPQSYS